MSKAFGEDNYNPDEVTAPVRESDSIKIGEENAPLICKLVVDPRRPNDAYYKVLYHRYMVGPNPQKDGRFMLSPKAYKEKDPIADAYWNAHAKAKELKLKGKEESPEYRRLETEKKVFGNHERYHMLVVPLNGTAPKVLTTVGMVVDILFGKEAYKDKPATAGLIAKMRNLKRNPFNLKNKTGWLKIWKTGQGIETRYHAEEYVVETTMKDENGEDVAVKRPFAAEVSPSIFELEVEQVPDLSQVDSGNSKMIWSASECQAYVDSFGAEIPERCQRKDQNQNRSSSYAEENEKVNTQDEGSLFDEDTQVPPMKASPKTKAASNDLDGIF